MRVLLCCMLFACHTHLSAQPDKVDSLRSLLDQSSSNILQTQLLLEMSRLSFGHSTDSSYAYADRAREIAFAIGKKGAESEAYFRMGRVKLGQGKADTALLLLTLSQEIDAQMRDSTRYASLMLLIASCHEKTGDQPRAQEIYLTTLDYAREKGLYVDQIDALNALAVFSLGQRDVPKSIEYLEESLLISENRSYPNKVVRACINLSVAHDSIDIRLAYLNRANEIAVNDGNMYRELSYIYSSKSNIFYAQGRYDEAINIYREAIDLMQRQGNRSGELTQKRFLAMSLNEAREYREAEEIYKEIMAARDFDSFKSSEYIIPKALSEVLYNQKKYKESYDTLLSAYHKAEIIYAQNIEENAAEATIKYETAQKEEELAKQALKISQQQVVRNQIIGGSLLLLLLSGGIGLWYYQRQSVKKKIAELQLDDEKKEKERLKKLDKMKTQFFTNVSHELKTPLTLIMGPLSSAIEDASGIQSKTDMVMAYRNAEKLNELINETLDLAKLDSEGLSVDPEPRVLYHELERMFYSFSSLAEMRDIDLISHNQIGENRYYEIDYKKLEKIVNNLVSNAIKFSPNRANVIMKCAVTNGELLLSITDQGGGIPADEHELIFNRFYQSLSNKDSNYGGTGVGLAYSQELAQLMHGKISVKSEVGQGSTFYLSLPVTEANGPSKSTIVAVEINEKVEYKPILINGEKPKLLVVEDNKEMQTYLGSILKSEYRCDFAVDGFEALKMLQTNTYHLVSSDVMMPTMDGFTLKKRINEMDKFKNLPFIFLTARSLDDDRLEGLQLGVDDYILKPFNKDEYTARIHNLIANYKSRRAAESEYQDDTTTESIDIQTLRKAEKYILEHLADPSLKITDLADHLHYSQRQMARVIKQLTGYTPVGFVLELRLQRAHHMLISSTKQTITEVRDAVGIESASYFTRKFKERYGVTPGDVRATA